MTCAKPRSDQNDSLITNQPMRCERYGDTLAIISSSQPRGRINGSHRGTSVNQRGLPSHTGFFRRRFTLMSLFPPIGHPYSSCIER